MVTPEEIARLLGGEVAGHDRALVPGPGHSSADRSLSVRVKADGSFIVWSFAGDDWRECRDHVARALGGASRRGRGKLPTGSRRSETAGDEARRIELALRIWRQTFPAAGSATEDYLRSRGLDLPVGAERVLRHHRRLRFDDGFVPGMVALMTDIITDQPRAIHRTFLEPDGTKIGGKMYGAAKGCAIKLAPKCGDRLVIGEGIETSLAAVCAGMGPAWALGSEGGIKTFPVIADVRSLMILGELDDHQANDRAAHICSRRWIESGRKVWVIEPTTGEDFAAVFKKLGAEWRTGVTIKRGTA